MAPFSLTDPEIFLGCEQSKTPGPLYVKAWKVSQKDASNPGSFNNAVFTAGTGSAATGSQLPHYDGLKIFNGEIKGRDLNRLCIYLQQHRLRVNLDGYSYHAAEIARSTTSITRYLRMNDLFDWAAYAEPVLSGSRFEPEHSQTTWNRHSQTSATSIRVSYMQLDKELEELTDKLKTKQDELRDLQQKYNECCSHFKPGRPIPPSHFVDHSQSWYSGNIATTWVVGGVLNILDELPDLPRGGIPVKYTVDFDKTGWRAVTAQNGRGHKSKLAIYEGNYSSDSNGPFPSRGTADQITTACARGHLSFNNYGPRWVIYIGDSAGPPS